jgi:hypothetical protein
MILNDIFFQVFNPTLVDAVNFLMKEPAKNPDELTSSAKR